ncbi:MAG: hypothetical protein AB7O96_00745 [Pseudobdellovibrionaceae bacterium]
MFWDIIDSQMYRRYVMATLSRIGLSGVKGFFTTTVPLWQRCFSTSSRVLQSLPKQEATISPKLKETLLIQLREAAKQEKPNPLGCNCLPLKGTPEFDRMAEDFIKRVKESKVNN